MPEGSEYLASAEHAKHFHEEHISDDSWTVKALHADATSHVIEKAKSGSPLSQGMVMQLDATCKWKRGNVKAQTPLWPPMWCKNKRNPDPPPISELKLKGISCTSRSLILDLGKLRFQV